MAANDIRIAGPIGRTLTFAAASLVPRVGQTVTAAEMFAEYEAWCVANSYVPLREAIFRDEFASVAQQSGIPMHRDGTSLVYLDVALTP